MNAQSTGSGVVLRHTVFVAEAARIGRELRPAAPTSTAAAAGITPGDTAPATDRDMLLQAALAAARAEGLRLGREEGLRCGHEEGLRKGQADAQTAGRTALEKAIAHATTPLQERERQLAALVAAVGAQQAAWHEQTEEEAVALAFELACRVVGDALVTPEGVRAQARRLLAATRHQSVAFHVHPDDLAVLGQDAIGTSWVADPTVGAGGCIVRSPAGALDARLEIILGQCRDALLELRARRGGAAQEQAE